MSKLLTSTWSQRLYFSHISAISCIGSKAPYTVVPAVAFTKRGMYPYNKNNGIKYKIQPLSDKQKQTNKNHENHFRNVATPFSCLKMFFFPSEKYTQVPTETEKLTAK